MLHMKSRSHMNESWEIWISQWSCHTWMLDHECCISLRSRTMHTNDSITWTSHVTYHRVMSRALHPHVCDKWREPLEKGHVRNKHTHTQPHTHTHTTTHTHTHACKHAQVYTEWREPFEDGIQRIRQSWHTHTHTPIYRVERALTRGDAENGTAVPHAHAPIHT